MKKINALLLSILILLNLSGCRLAKDEEEPTQDSHHYLIGIYITTSPIETKTAKIEGTYYKDTNEIIFENIDGHYFGFIKDNNLDYYTTLASDTMASVLAEINSTDFETTSTKVSVKLYYDETKENITFYIHLIYSNDDEGVYMLIDDEIISVNDSIIPLTRDYSQTLENVKINTSSYHFEILSTFSCDQVIFMKVNKNRNQEVIPFDMNKDTELSFDKDTAYILAKLINMDGTTTYHIINEEDQEYLIFLSNEDSILTPKAINIINNNEEGK